MSTTRIAIAVLAAALSAPAARAEQAAKPSPYKSYARALAKYVDEQETVDRPWPWLRMSNRRSTHRLRPVPRVPAPRAGGS